MLEIQDYFYLSYDQENILPIVDMKKIADIETWFNTNATLLKLKLYEKGAILFRNCVSSTRQFQILCNCFSKNLIDYIYRSTPRQKIGGNVYTSTEYAADQIIPQHNENAYSDHWPDLLMFGCLIAAETGGETPLADSRKIYKALPIEIKSKFIKYGIKYVRNYTEIFDLRWQEVFQTTCKEEVENYCRSHNISYEWISQIHLRTEQICQALLNHPITGDVSWFNQAHLFHISALDKIITNELIKEHGVINIPRNAFYGDNSLISDEIIAYIQQTYQHSLFKFRWDRGDFLLIDNRIMTHGRMPYKGSRKIIVAMGKE